MDIAVIGSGIAGLSCAWHLRHAGGDAPNVTLFESDPRAGGHANTVDVTLDGTTHPVDTGFLVFNRRTYPGLVAWFDRLGVETLPSEMTFSVRLDDVDASTIEWAGTDLGTVFTQRANLVRPRFLRMLADLLRFNRAARALAAAGTDGALDTWTLGEYLDAHHYSAAFRDWYLLPMAAAIWSCSTAQMHDFPLSTFVRFCANHGLLQIVDRPQWFTVRGGSRTYVDRVLADLPDVRLGQRVLRVARVETGRTSRLAVATANGASLFDHVVFACHSDQALRALHAPDRDQRDALGAVRYQPNRAILHTDTRVLPSNPTAWAAWNYRSDLDAAAPSERRVAVHYLIDKLQPLPFDRPVIVSLNPTRPIDEDRVLQSFDYEHPVFDRAALVAQTRIDAIQGRGNVWFCGAWTGHGFHEDGMRSGCRVADAIHALRVGAAEVRLAA